MVLYGELTPWYHLLDPTEGHEGEAGSYLAGFEKVIAGGTLLDLGSGAGNNAFFLKRRFRCTLADVSEPMLALSRARNPDCEHVLGDMRTLRLGRTFDAVLVHDAVTYMTNERDLAAAIETAFVHTRPGGAAIFAPDFFRETFAERSDLHEGDDARRAMRCLEWTWDPDANDTTYTVEYAFLLREGTTMKVVHERHVEGLFPRATWRRLFSEAGFEVETIERALDEDGATDQVFLCHRR